MVRSVPGMFDNHHHHAIVIIAVNKQRYREDGFARQTATRQVWVTCLRLMFQVRTSVVWPSSVAVSQCWSDWALWRGNVASGNVAK